MKNLFDASLTEETKERILLLHPESERQWGIMTVTQTLAHCTSGMEMATGILRPKRAPFPAPILGVLIRPLVFRDDKPMRRNSPSAPELFSSDGLKKDFQHERVRLIAAIENFAVQGAPCCTQYPHPFFGPLNPEQWAILMYKHVDHHLTVWRLKRGVDAVLAIRGLERRRLLIRKALAGWMRNWLPQ